MELKSKKSFSKSPKAVKRRERVIKRLENQLVTGYKPVIENKEMSTIPLTESDRIRIKHEIAILKSRI